MKKSIVKLMFPAFALGAFFAACSNDDTLSKSDNKIETVAEVDSLPDCDASNEDEVVLVKSDFSLRVCANKKWVEIIQNSDGSYDYKCETKALKDGSGIKIICGGDSIGVLKNLVGKEGDKGDPGVKGDSGAVGPQGEAGKSCTAEVLEDFTGVKMVCGGDSVGVIRNGNDGANGAGCSLKQIDDTQLQIKCGDDSTTFYVHSEAPSSSSYSGVLSKPTTITGTAIMGPFEMNSKVTLKEMRIQGDSLSYTGREFTGEVSGLKGDYVIPDVTLDYPYAEVSVTGKWRNEVTGTWSNESMTLYALTDFSDGHTKVNVNLLTHFEYARAKKLIKDKGYSVLSAKKQADNAIVSALDFSVDMGLSENLGPYMNLSNNENSANEVLLAFSLLFTRNENDATIKASIKDFMEDVAEDGLWNKADAEKQKMANWLLDYDASQITENINKWGILDVPNYKKWLGGFLGVYYALGLCDVSNGGIVKQPTANNKDGVHFICKDLGGNVMEYYWKKATDLEWETYGWEAISTRLPIGKSAESGNVYIYDRVNEKWRYPENDYEKDTYDFTDTVGLGHDTKQCYMKKIVTNKETGEDELKYEEISEIEADLCLVDDGTSCYVDLVQGLCTGKYYATCLNSSGAIVDKKEESRLATDLEIYLGKICYVYEKGYGKTHTFATSPKAKDSVFVCKSSGWEFLRVEEHNFAYGSLLDKRNGQTYKTVAIGNQTWMAENLLYCPKDGECHYRLRENEIVKSKCPDGWRLPTREDFKTLIKFVDKIETYTDENTAGEKLLSANDMYSVVNPSHPWKNDYGFSGLTEDYWTSEKDANYYYFMRLNETKAIIYSANAEYGQQGYVRCIQDTPAANP